MSATCRTLESETNPVPTFKKLDPPSKVGDIIAKGTSDWKCLRMTVKLTTQS